MVNVPVKMRWSTILRRRDNVIVSTFSYCCRCNSGYGLKPSLLPKGLSSIALHHATRRNFTGEVPSQESSESSMIEQSRLGNIHLMDHDTRPLGTFGREDWHFATAEIARCLAELPNYDGSGETEEGSKNDKYNKTDEWVGMGRTVLEADKLLARLSQEAATRSFISRSFLEPGDLCMMSIAALKSWIKIHRVFPETPIPLQFAQNRFYQLIQELRRNHLQGIELENDALNTIRRAFLDLVQGWCRLESLDEAIELLTLSETPQLFQDQHQDVIPVFHETLHRSLATFGAEESSARLLKHMEYISHNVPYWSGIRPSEQQIQQALGYDGLSGVSLVSDDRKAAIDNIETRSSFRRLVSRVNQAAEADEETATEAIALMDSLDTKNMQMILSLALVEYYLRINDVTNTTVWLGHVDAEDLATFDRCSEILGKTIVLWILKQDEDASAGYRAEEVLDLFEKVSKINGQAIDHRLYLAVAKVWLKSGGLWRYQKAAAIALRPQIPSFDLFALALDAWSQTGQKNSADVLPRLCRCFEQLLESMSPEQAKDCGETLVSILTDSGLMKEALTVSHMLRGKDIRVSAEVFDILHSSTLLPYDNSEVLKKLMSTVTPFDPQLALVLIRSLKPDQSGDHKRILADLLSFAVAEEKGELPALFSCAIDKLMEWNDLKGAREVLAMAEREIPDSNGLALPLQSYQDLIAGLVQNRSEKLASELFHRIRMTQTQTTNYPNSDFCWHYMSNVRGKTSWVLSECTNVLNWLVGIYRKTGDRSFKPKATMYTKILYVMANPGRSVGMSDHTTAFALVDEMLELEAHDGDVKPFHQAMRISYNFTRDDRFDLALALYRKIEATEGVEPDEQALRRLLWAAVFYRRSHSSTSSFQLKTVLEIFANARQIGIVNEESYSVCLKVVERLPIGQPKEPLIERLFQMCCSDGFLGNNVRNAVRELLPDEAWNRVYTEHLDQNNREPDSWSRNAEGTHIERLQNSERAV